MDGLNLLMNVYGIIPSKYQTDHGSYEAHRKVYFYAPTIKRYETDDYVNKRYPFFIPVSITGKKCHLSCDHCHGIILSSMYDAQKPELLYKLALKLKEQGCEGLLISGGSEANGSVPLTEFAPMIEKMKHELGFKIAVHTGLVDEKMANALSKASIDVAMIDIIGSDETINQVYHLKASVASYENSLKILVDKGIKASPHVVVGLHYGKILGEYNAFEIISRYNIASLVLIILAPLCNTPMAKVNPPDIEDIRKIIISARKTFPSTPILLGCARPGGRYRFQIDKIALDMGINGIAYPSEGIVEYARQKGLSPVFSEYCCSFVFEEFGSDSNI